jgi:phosphate/sulfate permease
MRVTAIILAIVGVALWARSGYVFDTCGYDCPILPGVVGSWGFIPVLGSLLAIVLFLAAGSLVVIDIVRRRRQSRRVP